jgi:hypothetical protein
VSHENRSEFFVAPIVSQRSALSKRQKMSTEPRPKKLLEQVDDAIRLMHNSPDV